MFVITISAMMPTYAALHLEFREAMGQKSLALISWHRYDEHIAWQRAIPTMGGIAKW